MNVINQEEIKKHVIERYRFKVLNSSGLIKEEHKEESDEDEFQPTKIVKNINEQDQKEESENQQKENDNSFVEELLKKSDELSSNIIKLQMQIEKQEKEFQKRLEDEVKKAKESAFQEGYEKAKAELEEDFENAKKIYFQSAEKFDENSKKIEEFFAELREEIATTALEIAKEVIQKEISKSSSKIAEALSKELIEDLKGATKISIKVNPEDFEHIKEIYSENKIVEVEADNAISKGGVVLLSDIGNLDGNLNVRLEKVKYLLEQDKVEK